MKIKSKGISLLIASQIVAMTGTLSNAGDKQGNGGGGVFCEGRTIRGEKGRVIKWADPAPMILDYYEAKLVNQDNLISIDSLSEAQVIELFFNRLAELNASNAVVQKLKNTLETVIKDQTSWINTPLQPLDDSKEAYALPSNCKLEQIINRQGLRIYSDLSKFNALPEAQKGLLKLHEAIYFQTEASGDLYSINVRKIIEMILDKTTTAEEFNAFIAQRI